MTTTSIEWATDVWNPTTGCDRVSPGCDHCYALKLAKRLKAMGSAKYQTDGDPKTSGPGFGIAMHPDALKLPLTWRKPRRIFVNSMSDLFHDGVTDEFIAKVFAVMAACPQHTFQVLTKRHARMRSLLNSDHFQSDAHSRLIDIVQTMTWEPEFHWPLRNVHLGVSTENQKWADIRIPALLDTPAAVRWISAEPLLGPIDLFGPADQHGHRPKLTYWLDGRPGWSESGEPVGDSGLTLHSMTTGPRLDWIVVGGESGPGARPMHPDWVRALRDQCRTADVPFHFKQWGDWAPESHCATERGARSALYIERDGATRTAAWGARGDAVTIQCNGKHRTGRRLDGRTWDEYPAVTT